MPSNPGIFTISLDFELHWGGFEKWSLAETNQGQFGPLFKASLINPDYRRYFLNTRLEIPEMLQVFKRSNIHVTWATVGMLFHENRSEMEAVRPTLLPQFEKEYLSAYRYCEKTGIGEGETDDPFHFAGSLIRQISSTPGMEIGSHTYAHYYACEPGQTAQQFRADLQAARKLAAMRGIELHSLVLPRNQVNPDYLSVCNEEGFTAVRTNPKDWFWEIPPDEPVSFWKRLNRTADAYIPIGERKSYPLSAIRRKPGEPFLVPASRFLRPYKAHHGVLNSIRLNRVLKEMETAARNNEVYHLWWHPHNFGFYPRESMEGLERIASAFARLHEKYGMQSLNMSELVALAEQQ